MRWLSQLLVILVICLVAVALPAAPVQAIGPFINLSPHIGVPGEEITVYGGNFTPDRWVDIYYYQNGTRTWVVEAETDDGGDFDVDFVVPESYTGDHEVRAEDDNDLIASEDFTVKPGLTVSPDEGPVGTNVTVQGHGFAEEEEGIELRYYLDGDFELIAENMVANDDGWWSRSFLIPASARGNHKLDARGNLSSLPHVEDAFFEVAPGISLAESSGSPGDSITATGGGFAINERDITILFDGQEVETEIRADETGYWQQDFEVPERPKGTYDVTAEGEFTSQEDINVISFEIEPGLVLSPDEGHVGTDLTVTGGGFPTDKNVVIEYDGIQKATATTNDEGSFEASFPVPESQHGQRTVTTQDAAGNNATAIFTVESDPPGIPELISPPEGERTGFIGSVRPTFEWSEVSDESGVRYNLQIATSANVTAAGLVDPRVSNTDIVGTNYTLQREDALPSGTYYWVVRAVDRAGNAGNWSAVYSFRAGILPLWAFILIVVAGVAVIGTLIYFFIIRKRIYYY
ncbi:MAG: hypothetical protein A2Z77_09500 [Chloroflexi bacterium RBG_13_51_36]|nr:MAG: hypothetical protein A2Z77_09500 [Chloroflexi bacterium RBG_13_51_36]